MPKYSVDINRPVTDLEFISWVDELKNPRDKAMLSALFLTGGRDSEVLNITRKDVFDLPEDPNNRFCIKLINLKQGKKSGYRIDFRILEFQRSAPGALIFLNYVELFSDPEFKLFPITPRWMRYIVAKVSGKQVCPYNFRHSRLYRITQFNPSAREGDLKLWKGGGSVEEYMKGKPFGKGLVIK